MDYYYGHVDQDLTYETGRPFSLQQPLTADQDLEASQIRFGSPPPPKARQKIGPYDPAQDPEALDTDFRRKYPPEPLGREMDDGARVWKVYRDEATAHDTTTLDGWNKTLDILLIFAGLFSAVATAFVVESYKLLQLDSSAYSANALYALLNHTNPSSVVSLPLPPDIDASPTALSRWINGLWFTSLAVSLAVALLCIMVKQWIGEYVARNNASARNARDWARRHQVYFQGLSRWPVAELVAVLPVMLHLSLFLFFAGIVGFLWDLDLAIGVWVIVLGIALTGFYLVCFLLPLWFPEAPTATPLIKQVRRTLSAALIAYWSLQRWLAGLILHSIVILSTNFAWHWVQRCFSLSVGERAVRLIKRMSLGGAASPRTAEISYRSTFSQRLRDFRLTVEDKIMTLARRTPCEGYPSSLVSQSPELDAGALKWLILSVSDSDAVAVGLQALGARGRDAPWVVALRHHEQVSRLPIEAFVVYSAATMHPVEVMRAVRAILCLRERCVLGDSKSEYNDESGRNTDDTTNVTECFDISRDLPPAMRVALCRTDQPDAALFSAFYERAWQHVRNSALTSVSASSLTSTIIMLFELPDISPYSALHLLLCVRFRELSVSDWGFILGYYRDCQIAKDPRIVLTPTERFQTDGIKELFCHVTRFLNQRENTDYWHPAIALHSKILCSEEFEWHLKAASLPWISAYLVSQAFAYTLHSSAVVQCALSLLADAILLEPQGAQYRPQLLRACSSTLQLAEHTQGISVSELNTVALRLCHVLCSFIRPSSHLYVALDSETPKEVVEIITLILKPDIASRGCRKSLMELLYPLGDKHMWWHLMDHIATVLCTLWRRGVDVRWQGADFASLLPWNTLLAAVPPDSDAFPYWLLFVHPDLERAARVALHCIEIRPDWWDFVIEGLMDESVTEDTCDRILRLGIVMERSGTCRACPGNAPDLQTLG